MREKTYQIRDPIHGTLHLSQPEIQVVDALAYQRLRHIKQLGLADLAEAHLLVPVQLEGRREVVDLGQVDVLGAHSGLLVDPVRDRLLEAPIRCIDGCCGVGCQVRQVQDRVRVGRRDDRDAGDPHRIRDPQGPCVVHRGDQQGRSPVAGGTDLQQAQGVGDDGRVGNVPDAVLLGEPGIGVVHAVPAVLGLDQGEVLACRSVEGHAAPGVHGEVHRVGRPHQVEPQPVGVVGPPSLVGGQEPLRGRVRPDHQGHLRGT